MVRPRHLSNGGDLKSRSNCLSTVVLRPQSTIAWNRSVPSTAQCDMDPQEKPPALPASVKISLRSASGTISAFLMLRRTIGDAADDNLGRLLGRSSLHNGNLGHRLR